MIMKYVCVHTHSYTQSHNPSLPSLSPENEISLPQTQMVVALETKNDLED